ncbi:MAG TPA: hypothetical protein VFY26_00980 [Anaerolineales bacterium]|nr:hypothetical protein [Anaerolineales bacterium]
MSNPFTAIVDGLSIAGMHWQLVSGILLVVAACQLLLYILLRGIFEERLTPGDYYAFSLAGWLVPALFLSILWYALAWISTPQAGSWFVLAVAIAAGLVLFFRMARRKVETPWGMVPSLVLLTVLFLVLRLAFVSGALLPLYFDSAQHYRYINEILLNLESPGAGTWSLAAYYHLGFHFLAAFITSLTGSEITDAMLVLGQIFLATMPFSVFFIVRHITQSSYAGIFALILAAFGWYMPAHAVDWGKYPALASLTLIPFVVGAAYLSIQYKNALTTRTYWSLNILFLGGVLFTVFLHSRSLVVFVMIALAGLVSRLAGRWRLLVLLFVLSAVVLEVVYIQTKGILGPLFDPYGMKAILVTAPILLLSVFAWRSYPGLVIACSGSAALLIASLFVPIVGVIPGFPNTTLLDRPYVEMILYLPLTLLGGFGLAGLEQRLQAHQTTWNPGRIIGMMFITLALVNALLEYDLYPSDCCAITSEDDLAAIQWMDENLPKDALILTSSTSLNVLPTDEYQGSAGGDAGTWVTPLIGRPSTSLPFHTDFSQQETRNTLCNAGVDYVYVGQTGYFFNDSGMPVQPDGYRIVFALPKARVYEVTGCD